MLQIVDFKNGFGYQILLGWNTRTVNREYLLNNGVCIISNLFVILYFLDTVKLSETASRPTTLFQRETFSANTFMDPEKYFGIEKYTSN